MKPFFHLLLERIPVRRWVRLPLPSIEADLKVAQEGVSGECGRIPHRHFQHTGTQFRNIDSKLQRYINVRDIRHALSTISIAFFATKFASNVNKQIQRIHWQQRLQVDSSVFLVRSHLDHETLL